MTERVPLDPFRAQKARAKATEDEKRKLMLLVDAYKKVFATDMGRLVIRDLLEYCQTFETTMTGNSWTYFNEGKRAVGLHILYMREYGVEQELKFMQEETYKKIKEREKDGN